MAKDVKRALMIAHEVGSPERQQAFDQWGGAPDRWYHGTSKDVDFSKFKIGRHGAWFARDPKSASMYAESNDSQGHKYDGRTFVPFNTRSRVIPVHLKLGKSHTGPLPDSFKTENYKKAQSEWFDQLRAQGFDSWVPEGGDVAVVLKDPTQIKSAIGNRGTFDPNEADIGKAAGGSATKRALMIARDQRALLRRIANIYPGPGGGMDPSPGGGGYSGPGGGKYIGPSHYADGGGVDDYGGEHRPPGPDGGAPLHDLTANGTVYPDDVYGPQGVRYYGTGDVPMDRQTLKIAHEVRGKPEAQIPVFRAVPKTAGDTINHGDWVTTNPAYARAHGESALRGKYKVIGKTVRADEVFTNGDSLHEYGYWSRAKRADGGSVPPFKLHSGAAKIIKSKGQAKATPQQYAAMPGIKPDELKHSKFDTLGSKALPREEVIKHLEDNAVPLQETTYTGDDSQSALNRFGESQVALPGGKNYREVLLHTPAMHTPSPELAKARARAEAATRAFDDALNDQLSSPDDYDPAYTRASLEADNARIALARLEREDQSAASSAGFRGGHWDQPNVLAHVRMSDRRGPNGEKVLHVEEVQSDWGQQGRERGFKDPDKYKVANEGGIWRVRDAQGQRLDLNGASGFSTEEQARAALQGNTRDIEGIPSGPYVDNTQKWADLALKRVLHEAAHGGYDKIVVTPGDEQNKRYSLAAHVKELRLHDNSSGGIGLPSMEGPFTGGSLDAIGHDGTRHAEHVRDAAHLRELVGKDAAEKLLAQEPKSVSVAGLGLRQRALGGQDLMMGGAGMRGYYDNILPKRLQALAQQHDPQAKVNLHAHDLAAKPSDPFEEHKQHYADSYQAFEGQPHANDAELRNWARDFSPDDFHGVDDDPVKAAPLHSLDVTPQMRDSIKQGGFNSFKRGGEVGDLKFKRGGNAPDDDRIRAYMARVLSPFSDDPDVVQRALDVAAGYKHDLTAVNKDAGYYKINQAKAPKDVTSKIRALPGVALKIKRPMTWEDLHREGTDGSIINLGGDRQNLGRLTHINGKKLAWAVDLHAGPRYMLEPNPDAVWSNNQTHATGLKNKILEAASKNKGPVYGVYSPMGPRAVDSSHNMFNAVMAQIPGNNLDAADAAEFDRQIKNGLHVAPEKRAASKFARTLPGVHRSAIIKHMDKTMWLAKGFPAIGMTRMAITDPDVAATPGNMLGHRVVRLDPDKIAKETRMRHSTYSHPTGGEYVGDIDLAPRQDAMPEPTEEMVANPDKKGQIIHPYSEDYQGRSAAGKMFEEQKQIQPLNTRQLDSVMSGIERYKKYGFKKGGRAGYALSGRVEQLGRDLHQSFGDLNRQVAAQGPQQQQAMPQAPYGAYQRMERQATGQAPNDAYQRMLAQALNGKTYEEMFPTAAKPAAPAAPVATAAAPAAAEQPADANKWMTDYGSWMTSLMGGGGDGLRRGGKVNIVERALAVTRRK